MTLTPACRAFARLAALAACLAAASPAAAAPPAGFNFPDLSKASAIRAAGFTTARVWVSWANSEPSRDSYSWYESDQYYNALVGAGIRPVMQVMTAPAWAGGCASQACPPSKANDGQFTEFMKLLAQRYPQALAFEIWNEPNLQQFWGKAPDPARYTEILKAGYKGVKQGNPRAPVITGGLAGTAAAEAGQVGDDKFLAGIYKAGGKGSFDGIGYHPYPDQGPTVGSFRAKLDRIRGVRNANKDSVRHLWITEVGVATQGPGDFDKHPSFTPEGQAERTARIYKAAAQMPDIDALIFFTWADIPGSSPSASAWDRNLGLHTSDGAPKPAYQALVDAVADPSYPQPPVAIAGNFAPDRWAPVTFTASGLPAGATYEWDTDGNGAYEKQTGTNPSATVKYPKSGTYTLTLRAADEYEYYVVRKKVTVKGNGLPIPAITLPPVIKVGVPVTFDGSASRDSDSGTLRRWVWTIGIERGLKKVASGQKFTRVYSQPGTYKASLKVWDNLLGTSVKTVTFKVAPNPVRASIKITQAGPNVTFDASGSLPPKDATSKLIKYVWYIGIERGRTKVVSGPKFTRAYTASGTYDVRLKVIDSSKAKGWAKAKVTVSVPKPAKP